MSGLFSQEDAAAIVAFGADRIQMLARLTGSGLGPAAIVAHAKALLDGEDTVPELALGKPKTLVIQAYSFLRDVSQYRSLYGMTDERAAQLRVLYDTDRPACLEEIERVVSEKLRAKNSQKPVLVTEAGQPGSAPEGAGPLVLSSGRLKTLKAEIASRSAVYGMYVFEAVPTSRELAQAFSADLGWNCFVLGQSKELVKAAARIVRVKGRLDPSVMDYVHYIDREYHALNGTDIPENVPLLTLGPRDTAIPSSRTPVRQIVAPGGKTSSSGKSVAGPSAKSVVAPPSEAK